MVALERTCARLPTLQVAWFHQIHIAGGTGGSATMVMVFARLFVLFVRSHNSWLTSQALLTVLLFIPHWRAPHPESVTEKYRTNSTAHAIWPTPWKSERARKASNKETAPRCHSETHQAGHQKASRDLYGVQSCCPIYVYLMDTHHLTSKGGQGNLLVREDCASFRCAQ